MNPIFKYYKTIVVNELTEEWSVDNFLYLLEKPLQER